MQYYNSVKKVAINNRVGESQTSVKKPKIIDSFLSPPKRERDPVGHMDSDYKSVGLGHLRVDGSSSES